MRQQRQSPLVVQPDDEVPKTGEEGEAETQGTPAGSTATDSPNTDSKDGA